MELKADVATIVSQIVVEVVENGASLLDPSTFLALMSHIGVDSSVQDLNTDSLAQLQDILTAGTTCGTELLAIINKITNFVVDIKEKDIASTATNIRQAVSTSQLFLTDIPAVTNNCIRNLTDDAFSTRDSLRAVMSTITDGLVDGAVDNAGNAKSTSEYLASVAKMGLDVIITLDPTGIADMISTFIQPICGPTVLIREIDDGFLTDALALTTEGHAFNGSYGMWTKSGDGTVNVIFESYDTKDVIVVIHSGGDTIAKVHVPKGATVSWNSTVKELQDKTFYFDRWRPGRLGVLGSAGGSLLTWVPRSSTGGKIELHAILNGDGEETSVDGSSGTENGQNGGSGADTKQKTVAEVGTEAPTPATSNNKGMTDRKSGVGDSAQSNPVQPKACAEDLREYFFLPSGSADNL
ncbi:unnamed protein product [Phytophthora lilii]|uniref:Unnamed protein product n=1 Tax=Phytophthora lilii TaxID=2077276 RepID=A0A9W7D9D5_9STRA|nr:unnamed protein product [Phytophthora lilii]